MASSVRVWLNSVESTFSIDDAAPGCPPPASAASTRYSRISSTSVRIRASASLRENAASSSSTPPSGPGACAAAVAISSANTCRPGAAAPPPRSNSSRYFATVQPSSIWPMTLLLGTRTSSKKTWFWTSSPDVMTSGRISIPGVLMSIRTKVMPCCFLAVRVVRTSANIQFASVA
ncbi:Uncharacterised protein [Mycobacteroides abscessus subsp. abscessus]|nr:Uncharacterised protein [Mycobacteroides abscessus subsp. abscessus]